MGTVYMILSIVLFLTETVLQIYCVSDNSQNSEGLFISLLALVMGPLILVNFVSAIQVTRTQDFSGKSCGRVICIVFHSFQLGMVWRSLKLLILFDSRDWLEYLSLRLVHCGFQSVPFTILLASSMFMYNISKAAHILTLIASLTSAALTVATYGLGDKLYRSEEFDKTSKKVRKAIGVILLICSCFLLLMSRCFSMVLFSVVQPSWLALPIVLQYIVHFISSLVSLYNKHKVNSINVVKKMYISFICLFDMVHKGFEGVRCKFVVYYAALLVQNIVMSAWWMLTADYGERFKLLTVVAVLMGFIIGIILKFASCGCVYEDSPDLLDDAFNSPIPPKNVDKGTNVPVFDSEGLSPPNSPQSLHQPRSTSPVPISNTIHSDKDRKSSSKHSKSSSSSSRKAKRQYDNHAFIWEPSKDMHSLNVKLPQTQILGESASVQLKSESKSNKKDKRSPHRNKLQMRPHDSNADLASSNSRNTNTLNISSQSMYNTGFDDPFRERKLLQATLNPHPGIHNSARQGVFRGHRLRDLSLVSGVTSLDSSELYPSLTSDTSSMASYVNTDRMKYIQNKHRQRYRPRYNYDSHDGYSTDISNSEYLSFNDYSMEDSSDWTTESSDSDGAQTWPPSNITILGLPEDSLSAKDSVSHWLETIDTGESVISDQRSVHDFSYAEDTDTGTAMRKFEIQTKKRKGRIKKFLPEPKGAFLKFCSLNYKSRHKQLPNRPYPVPSTQQTTENQQAGGPISNAPSQNPTVKLRTNRIQESVV